MLAKLYLYRSVSDPTHMMLGPDRPESWAQRATDHECVCGKAFDMVPEERLSLTTLYTSHCLNAFLPEWERGPDFQPMRQK